RNMVPRLKSLPDDRRDALTESLAVALGRAGGGAEGLELMKTVAKNQSNSLRVQADLFELALLAGDDGLMSDTIGKLRLLGDEDGSAWRLAEAARIVALASRKKDLSQLPQAKQRLAEISNLRPKWSRVAILEADIAKIESDPEKPDDVIAALNRAVELGERNI